MRKVEIQVHKVYAAKVSGQVVPVKILSEGLPHYGVTSGWTARNEKTGRVIRIKSAAQLRFECDQDLRRL